MKLSYFASNFAFANKYLDFYKICEMKHTEQIPEGMIQRNYGQKCNSGDMYTLL